MPVLCAPDGTKLAYRVLGEGTPLVCLPAGPMQDSAYLGELGGLSRRRQLILFDLRGTGRSQPPADTASYRCDRLVDDLEALRQHLGLDRMDLLAHCAGANLAVLYAARHPERIGRLVLITPSTHAVGICATSGMRSELVRLRRGEPWFGPASAAFEAIQATSPGSTTLPGSPRPSRQSRSDCPRRHRHRPRSRTATPGRGCRVG